MEIEFILLIKRGKIEKYIFIAIITSRQQQNRLSALFKRCCHRSKPIARVYL